MTIERSTGRSQDRYAVPNIGTAVPDAELPRHTQTSPAGTEYRLMGPQDGTGHRVPVPTHAVPNTGTATGTGTHGGTATGTGTHGGTATGTGTHGGTATGTGTHGGTGTATELNADLRKAVVLSGYLRQLFYLVVLLVALAGQVSGAVEALGIPLIWAIPAVGALELGGIVVLNNADVRRRLGERATGSRVLSVLIAAWAVAFNWMAHDNKLLAGFFAGMSALGYLVWLMHTENQRRDRLRATGNLPPVTPQYELVGHWIRHPWLTLRAKSLAKANPKLDLYSSIAAAQDGYLKERRDRAIKKVLHRKIRAAVDPTTADIAVQVYDMGEVAAQLRMGADYPRLTRLISADLDPDRLAGLPQQPVLDVVPDSVLDAVPRAQAEAIEAAVPMAVLPRVPDWRGTGAAPGTGTGCGTESAGTESAGTESGTKSCGTAPGTEGSGTGRGTESGTKRGTAPGTRYPVPGTTPVPSPAGTARQSRASVPDTEPVPAAATRTVPVPPVPSPVSPGPVGTAKADDVTEEEQEAASAAVDELVSGLVASSSTSVDVGELMNFQGDLVKLAARTGRLHRDKDPDWVGGDWLTRGGSPTKKECINLCNRGGGLALRVSQLVKAIRTELAQQN